MKNLILFLFSIVFFSCYPDSVEPTRTSIRLHGTYIVESSQSTWTWKFIQTSICGGELHTFAETNNTCGAYFYGQCSDTLVSVAGNLIPKIYTGNTWLLEDTIYYEISETETLKLYKP